MIHRRAFLGSGAAAALLPHAARAARSAYTRFTLSGTLQQGSLVLGHTEELTARITADGLPLRLTPKGAFAFGIEYDRTKTLHLVAHYADGSTQSVNLDAVARQYDIQKINGLPQQFVTPPPEVQERIKRENALVAEARKRDSDGTAFAEDFDWPAKGIISGTFGSQRIDNGKPMTPHFGVDIAAPEGAPIHAPADAVVSLAEPDFYLTGGTTVLDHGHGVSTTYIHQSELRVKPGDAVKRGDLIGLVGHKGRATGPHLHWSMNWFQMRLDPSLRAAKPAPDKA